MNHVTSSLIDIIFRRYDSFRCPNAFIVTLSNFILFILSVNLAHTSFVFQAAHCLLTCTIYIFDSVGFRLHSRSLAGNFNFIIPDD